MSATSASLWPRTMTALIFTGVSPTRCAARIPSSTRESMSTPVISVNDARFRLSRLTVTRPSPAAFNPAALSARLYPFVVSAKSFNPSTRASFATSVSMSRLSIGSAALDSNLLAPDRHEKLARRLYLLVRQQRLLRRGLLRRPVRQAVEATEVTPVCHRHAQVAYGSSVRVSEYVLRQTVLSLGPFGKFATTMIRPRPTPSKCERRASTSYGRAHSRVGRLWNRRPTPTVRPATAPTSGGSRVTPKRTP